MPRPPKDPRYEAILERMNRDLAAGAEEGPAPRFTAPLLIVGGLPRSGTTFCYQLLAASGSFVYPSNLVARFYRRPVAGWRVERALEPFLPPRDEGAEGFRSEAGRTAGWWEPSEMGYFWHAHQPFDEHHEPSAEVLAAWDPGPLARELAALQSEDGRPLVVKNPVLGFVYGWLLDRIPEARMAWISRPPLAIAASILAMRRREAGGVDRWWSTRPADADALAGRPPEEQVAGQVARLLVAGTAARERHGDRWLDVEYEAICRDPDGQARRIARFAGAGEPIPGLPRSEPAPLRGDRAILERLAAALRAVGVEPVG